MGNSLQECKARQVDKTLKTLTIFAKVYMQVKKVLRRTHSLSIYIHNLISRDLGKERIKATETPTDLPVALCESFVLDLRSLLNFKQVSEKVGFQNYRNFLQTKASLCAYTLLLPIKNFEMYRKRQCPLTSAARRCAQRVQLIALREQKGRAAGRAEHYTGLQWERCQE